MRVTFDRFVFDSDRRELLDGDRRLHLAPKAFRLLELLITGSPRALSKEELIDHVWEGTAVEESNLAGLVNEIRAALGDSARHPAFVRTVHGFGYAFAAPSSPVSPPPAAATIVFRGEGRPLREGANILGRDPSADVCIDDRTVSRRHARITIGDRGATLEDLDSKNGTFVDGRRLRGSTALADGQSFVLGDARLEYRTSGASTTITRADAP